MTRKISAHALFEQQSHLSGITLFIKCSNIFCTYNLFARAHAHTLVRYSGLYDSYCILPNGPTFGMHTISSTYSTIIKSHLRWNGAYIISHDNFVLCVCVMIIIYVLNIIKSLYNDLFSMSYEICWLPCYFFFSSYFCIFVFYMYVF